MKALFAVVLFVVVAAGMHGDAHVAAPAAGNAAVARHMAAASYGWDGGQWTCLDDLWTHENAAWNPQQWNLTGSGAYGIAQALPASKMASAGPDYMTNPATQIKWGLGYIRGRYGNPCSAWSAWSARNPHWY